MGHDEYRRCTFHSRANLPIQKRILINLRHVRHVRCNPIPVTALWKTTLSLSFSAPSRIFFLSLSTTRIGSCCIVSFTRRLRSDYEEGRGKRSIFRSTEDSRRTNNAATGWMESGYQFMRCNIVGTRLALGLLLGGNGMGHTEKPCIRGECLVRPCWRSTIIQAGEYQTG